MTGVLPTILVFIFGVIIGSFLNVCIYRLPRNLSIVRPPSSCPSCGEPIHGYDNIPILSYLLLKGRCRDCGGAISIRYLAIEFMTGVFFVMLLWLFGLSIELAIYMLFVSLLIVISFIDLEFTIIPDILSVGGLVAGLAISFFRPDFGIIDAILGVLLGGGVLWAIAFFYELLRKREGMGGGDIKLLGMIGAFCGIQGVIFTLIAGSFMGALVGIPLTFKKQEGMTYALPFGPFLSFGAFVYIIAGDPLVRALNGFLGGG
ncbi:MAG TPA: prepilin peptidase [Deltaproteobacteria bacterium]|nr:prepilin peptidase [Deltaproteobacteria bacterium]